MVFTLDPLESMDSSQYLDDYDPKEFAKPFRSSQSKSPHQFGADPLHVDHDDGDEYARSQRSKFKFKPSRKRRDEDARHRSASQSRDDYRSRHSHYKKQKKDVKRDERPFRAEETASAPQLDPDIAFRESLFDAMADDEGAAFWESVYGQPIPQVSPVKEGPSGELEAMTDEEYVAYIRAEMYKKTPQYLFEEKAKRDKAKKENERLAEQTRRGQAESERFRRQVDESLQKGRERKSRLKQASEWEQKWKEYQKGWEALGVSAATRIPWPVWSGAKGDIRKEDIESFFLNGPTGGKPELADLQRTLKAERVRWHPDKVQQKFGGQGLIDDSKMRSVTAVFQIIDRIWTDLRNKGA